MRLILSLLYKRGGFSQGYKVGRILSLLYKRRVLPAEVMWWGGFSIGYKVLGNILREVFCWLPFYVFFIDFIGFLFSIALIKCW